MAFKVKPEELKPGQDCKDFRPMFFNKSCCRSAGACDYAKQGYMEVGRFGEYCQGIKWHSILDKNNPPKGGSGVLLSNP